MTSDERGGGTAAASEPTLDRDIADWLQITEAGPEPETVHAARQASEQRNAQALERMPASLLPASEADAEIPGPGGSLNIRVLRPAADGPLPTIVYFHGGGWVVGSIDTHLAHARRICVQASAVVVSVGYRLAPENRFPAAFDDALAATQWAYLHRGELGGERSAFVAAGDSVGGQLAASVAIARRDAAQPLDAQLLLYPVIDVTGRYLDDAVNAGYMSRRTVNRGYALTLDGLRNYAQYYLEDVDSGDWRVSPIRAADLRGVAPAVVHTATLDVLRTEGNFYARDLELAGVDVIAREWPTLNHSYFGLGGVSAMANAAAAQAAEDLLAILARHGH